MKDLFQNQKTNWRYLVILIILAVIVSGGILDYLGYFEREIVSFDKFPEITKPEKPAQDETAGCEACKTKFISWCENCRSLSWPTGSNNSSVLSVETSSCLNECFDITFPKTAYCDNIKQTCKDFGVRETIKDETADWKTYRNENFIKFKYPSDWKLKEEVRNKYGRGVLSVELYSPDYKRDDNLGRVVQGYAIYIFEEYHTDCNLFKPIANQVKSFFCTSLIKEGLDPECMKNSKVVDIGNGIAVILTRKGNAMVFGNGLYWIQMSPNSRDKEVEKLFSSFVSSFEILRFASLERFFFENLEETILYQRTPEEITETEYGATEITTSKIKVTARICGNVDKVDFYYSAKESPQKWQLVGSGYLFSNTTDWEIKWDIPLFLNKKEIYISVKMYKNNQEFQSLPDRIFSNY